MELTEHHMQILRHMLGIDVTDVRSPKEYRDYFCACHGDADLAELAAAGMVKMYDKCSQYEWFTTTDAGKAAARASQRARLQTKSKRMYSRFLDISDCRPDLTFREFLTSPDYADTRSAV